MLIYTTPNCLYWSHTQDCKKKNQSTNRSQQNELIKRLCFFLLFLRLSVHCVITSAIFECDFSPIWSINIVFLCCIQLCGKTRCVFHYLLYRSKTHNNKRNNFNSSNINTSITIHLHNILLIPPKKRKKNNLRFGLRLTLVTKNCYRLPTILTVFFLMNVCLWFVFFSLFFLLLFFGLFHFFLFDSRHLMFLFWITNNNQLNDSWTTMISMCYCSIRFCCCCCCCLLVIVLMYPEFWFAIVLFSFFIMSNCIFLFDHTLFFYSHNISFNFIYSNRFR